MHCELCIDYMAIFKCKMCGGDLEIKEKATVCECIYCGTKQTVPSSDDEKKLQLFNRANRLRFNNEFNKAAGVYESIVAEFPQEPESYWGLVLCKYGIEYVDDEKTGRKIPTCHRTLPASVMNDKNFELAYEYANNDAKIIYREEAKTIDRIQKSILSIVENEDPYDVFICYKETDENGNRTEDSLLAQDIYTELVKEDYKVFFSRVTLRDKAGTEYEPYIYAALKSAKVMLVIGTKFEYFDAVWVKNEWGRFLSMMEEDKEKHLIPCFKNIDAYDIPEEFNNLQGLDMGEVTFFKNLANSIEKFVEKETVTETVIINSGPTAIEPLLKRAFMFLEDGEFKDADEYAEKVLDTNPECAEGYLVKVLAENSLRKRRDLSDCENQYTCNKDYQKAVRFADETLKAELDEYLSTWKEYKYNIACENMVTATTIDEFNSVISTFEMLEGYKDSQERLETCLSNINDINSENCRIAGLKNSVCRKNIRINELEKNKEVLNKALEECKEQYHRRKALSLKRLTISQIAMFVPAFISTIAISLNGEVNQSLSEIFMFLTIGAYIWYLVEIYLFMKKGVKDKKYRIIFLIYPLFGFLFCLKEWLFMKRNYNFTIKEKLAEIKTLNRKISECDIEILKEQKEIQELNKSLEEVQNT